MDKRIGPEQRGSILQPKHEGISDHPPSNKPLPSFFLRHNRGNKFRHSIPPHKLKRYSHDQKVKHAKKYFRQKNAKHLKKPHEIHSQQIYHGQINHGRKIYHGRKINHGRKIHHGQINHR